MDSSGDVYVGDHNNNRIQKITPAGVVSTFAGSGTAGHQDATGTAAQFDGPRGVTVDSSGILYVTEYTGNRIRKITPGKVVSTFAGSTAGQFNFPHGVAVDSSSGNVYVADRVNHRIRKIEYK